MTRVNMHGIGWAAALLGSMALIACGNSDDGEPSGTGGTGQGATELRSDKPFDAAPQIAETDFQAFVKGTNAFGFELYQRLAAGQSGNVFYSPLSTAMALAMTYAGAAGETESQMASVLHNTLPRDTYHLAFNKLAIELASRNIAPHTAEEGTKSVKLLPVNASWAQKDYGILPAYLDTLSTRYNAGQHILNFISDPEGSRVTINQWVADHTEQRIKDLLTPGSIDNDTRLVLTNALYFYGSWASAFDRKSTSDGVFHRASDDVTVSMMHATGYSSYAEGDGWQATSLPYDGGKTRMVIVLPAAGRFDEVRGKLDEAWVSQTMGAMTSDGEVRLSLPKFKFTWGTESFKDPLIALGMTDAFVFPKADFTGIEPTRELYIGDVLHQAFVAIDEDGTEAAAATAVVLKAGGIPQTPKDFTADRPFLFMIVDDTGTVMFVGQMTDPAAS